MPLRPKALRSFVNMNKNFEGVERAHGYYLILITSIVPAIFTSIKRQAMYAKNNIERYMNCPVWRIKWVWQILQWPATELLDRPSMISCG